MAKEPGKVGVKDDADKPQTNADVEANQEPLPPTSEEPPRFGDNTSSNGDANVRGLHGRDGSKPADKND